MSFSFPADGERPPATSDTVRRGFSGFTPAGAPKAIPLAVSKRAKWNTSRPRVSDRRADRASTPFARWRAGRAAASASARRINRTPRCARRSTRAKRASSICNLSMLPQIVRYGFLGPVTGRCGSLRPDIGRRHRAQHIGGSGADVCGARREILIELTGGIRHRCSHARYLRAGGPAASHEIPSTTPRTASARR